jgi:hypothetical protein
VQWLLNLANYAEYAETFLENQEVEVEFAFGRKETYAYDLTVEEHGA